MKQLFEFFPLIIFFAVYYKSDKDLYLSIAAVIIATLISLAALYIKERKVSTMMLVSTIILVVFGGLSLFLKNDIFFKMKPTIINALFAIVLIGSTFINKPVLKLLLNSSMKLSGELNQLIFGLTLKYLGSWASPLLLRLFKFRY